MLKTSKMLTITVPKEMYRTIYKEASKRNETVSGLIRKAFTSYVDSGTELYSDRQIQQLLRHDALSPKLQKYLDRLLGRQ